MAAREGRRPFGQRLPRTKLLPETTLRAALLVVLPLRAREAALGKAGEDFAKSFFTGTCA